MSRFARPPKRRAAWPAAARALRRGALSVLLALALPAATALAGSAPETGRTGGTMNPQPAGNAAADLPIQMHGRDGTPVTPGGPAPLPVTSTAPAPAAAAAPAADTGWLMPLRPADAPVPTSVSVGGSMPEPGHYRLTGEAAGEDFLLEIPDGVPPPRTLALTLRSSINVLPSASHMTVAINGGKPRQVPLDNLGPFAEVTVPAPGLVAGRNRIRIDVVQKHRIFCGPEATFAIWTEIALGQSGAAVAPGSLPLNGQGFMAAMQSQAAQGRPVEILTDGDTGSPQVRNIAAHVVNAMGWLPKIEVRPYYHVGDRIAGRARVAVVKSDQNAVSFRRGSGGAVVMLVEQRDGSTADLTHVLPPPPPATPLPALAPGRKTPLAQLGAPLIVGNSHYFRRNVRFVLPDDWLLLTAQKAHLNLAYRFADDLPRGALLLVKVNGRTVRRLPLDQHGGGVQPTLSILFRASLLTAGVNDLGFEMVVPGDPADLACAPRSTDMLAILGRSTLQVPPSPKMRRHDMGLALERLGGDGVVVPAGASGDPARNAERALALSALLRPLSEGGAATRLNVIGEDSAGLVPMGGTGLTRAMLQAVLDPRLRPPAPTLAVTTADPAPAPLRLALAQQAATGGAVSAGSEGDAKEEDETSEGEGGINRAAAWLWRPFTADGWVLHQAARLARLRELAFPNTSDLATWIRGRTGKAVLMQLDPSDPDNLWLVVAPQASITDVAARVDSFRRGSSGKAKGQLAILQDDGTWATWSAAWRPQLLEPLRPGNIRAVLGNYAAWSPLLFTVLVLAAALLSAIPALLFVVFTRRRGSRT